MTMSLNRRSFLSGSGALVVAYLVCAELLKRFAIAPAVRRLSPGGATGGAR